MAVDLVDPNDDGRLLFTELSAGSSLLEPKLSATADLNLKAELGISGTEAMPRILSDINIDWAWSLTDPDLTGGKPTVAFNNVQLDLGTFITDFAGPILQEVQSVIAPIMPVINALQERIPVLSDLAGETIRSDIR